jgi:hypothetical protein
MGVIDSFVFGRPCLAFGESLRESWGKEAGIEGSNNIGDLTALRVL